jgi:hypothetical protein
MTLDLLFFLGYWMRYYKIKYFDLARNIIENSYAFTVLNVFK